MTSMTKNERFASLGYSSYWIRKTSIVGDITAANVVYLPAQVSMQQIERQKWTSFRRLASGDLQNLRGSSSREPFIKPKVTTTLSVSRARSMLSHLFPGITH